MFIVHVSQSKTLVAGWAEKSLLAQKEASKVLVGILGMAMPVIHAAGQ